MLEIGYRRNELARSIRPGQTSSDLGLMIGKLTNPFFAEVADAVIAGARERGYVVVLVSADEDPSVERVSIDGLLGRRVAGLMIVPGSAPSGRRRTPSWLRPTSNAPVCTSPTTPITG